MDIVQLLRQSAQNGRGRTLTAEQCAYLLGTMGRMAFDRHQAVAAAEGAEMILQAYIDKYGDEIQEDIFSNYVVEGEVVDADEEAGQDNEGSGMDAPSEKAVEGPVSENSNERGG